MSTPVPTCIHGNPWDDCRHCGTQKKAPPDAIWSGLSTTRGILIDRRRGLWYYADEVRS